MLREFSLRMQVCTCLPLLVARSCMQLCLYIIFLLFFYYDFNHFHMDIFKIRHIRHIYICYPPKPLHSHRTCSNALVVLNPPPHTLMTRMTAMAAHGGPPIEITPIKAGPWAGFPADFPWKPATMVRWSPDTPKFGVEIGRTVGLELKHISKINPKLSWWKENVSAMKEDRMLQGKHNQNYRLVGTPRISPLSIPTLLVLDTTNVPHRSW